MMLSIGYKNYIDSRRIIAVIVPESRPIKNMVITAREKGKLIDATMGKRTKSVIIMDSDHVILSANTADTIVQRSQSKKKV